MVTPAPTGPTRTPTSSARAGPARAPIAAAIIKIFFIFVLLHGTGYQQLIARRVPLELAQRCKVASTDTAQRASKGSCKFGTAQTNTFSRRIMLHHRLT